MTVSEERASMRRSAEAHSVHDLVCTCIVMCRQGCSVRKSMLACLCLPPQGWMSGQAFAHSLVASVPVAAVDKYLARVNQLPHALAGCKVCSHPCCQRAKLPCTGNVLMGCERMCACLSGPPVAAWWTKIRKLPSASVGVCAAGVPK